MFDEKDEVMKINPKYCEKCGKRLRFISRIVQFDVHTGKPNLIRLRLECRHFAYVKFQDCEKENGHTLYDWYETYNKKNYIKILSFLVRKSIYGEH